MKPCFGMLGGDRRQAELCRLLRQDGHTVHTFGLKEWLPDEDGTPEAAESAPVVILPLPVCGADGLFNCADMKVDTAALLVRFSPGQLVLGGRVSDPMGQAAAEKGLTLLDYFAREELTVTNAAITAEGAIQTAMEHLDRTIWGTDCLVLGFGRIGKLLCRRIQGLGGHAAVFARKPQDRAWASACGYEAMDLAQTGRQLGRFRVVFNTIPSLILDAALLEQLRGGCLLVDLASQPGIDQKAAAAAGHSVIWARSLPGKLAPVTAAEAIRDTLYHILEERGGLV